MDRRLNGRPPRVAAAVETLPDLATAGPLRQRMRFGFLNVFFEVDVIVASDAGWRADPEHGDPRWRTVRQNGLVLACRAQYSLRDEALAELQRAG